MNVTMNINKIIVATDFSTVSDTAIEHALKLASVTKGELFVLHVLVENVGVEGAKLKIAKQLESKNVGETKVSSMVRIGNFINEIGKSIKKEIKTKALNISRKEISNGDALSTNSLL